MFSSVTLDEISINEQFQLSWPNYLILLSNNSVHNSIIALCPGFVIQPPGRFVNNKLPEGYVSDI